MVVRDPRAILTSFHPWQVHSHCTEGLAIVFRLPQPERSHWCLVVMLCRFPDTNLECKASVILGIGSIDDTYDSCGRLYAAKLDTLRGPFVTINPRELSTKLI